MYKTPFYHLHLDNLDTQQALDHCLRAFDQQKPQTIFFVNAHCFNISTDDDDYFNALERCDLLLNDGIGIKIASKLIGLDIKENMNGTDFIPKVLKLAAATRKGVYLLGAKPNIAEQAKHNLEAKHPGLDICGTASGYFSDADAPSIINQINESKAEIVVVGMGVPYQEKWIIKHRDQFLNAKVIIAGGAIIDFSANCVKRAPQWMQKSGLEWLFRFAQEPRRLFKRYFVGNFKFLLHVATKRSSASR